MYRDCCCGVWLVAWVSHRHLLIVGDRYFGRFLPRRHHAKKGEAAGFCYVNDGVLAVLHLAKAFGTVLTIDIGTYEGQQTSTFSRRYTRASSRRLPPPPPLLCLCLVFAGRYCCSLCVSPPACLLCSHRGLAPGRCGDVIERELVLHAGFFACCFRLNSGALLL